MRRLRRLPMVVTAALAMSAGAGAAPASAPPLHVGSHGPKVWHVQRLLGGHDGYVFTAVKPTFTHPANGLFGTRTAAAVTAMKFRLGYPKRLVRPIAGPYLFALLEGRATRPTQWVAIAAARVRAVEASQPTKLALAIRAYELDELGMMENPIGSNRGPCISTPCTWHGRPHSAIQASTGAFGAPWCLSGQQDAFMHVGYGRFAGGTASVYAAADDFAAHNQLHAKPKVGALVLFIDYDAAGHRIPGTGHAGFVVKVGAGWYVSTEGNQANGWHEVFHHLGDRGNVFAYIAGVA